VAPHEDSADGVAVIDKAFIKGYPVERLRLTFSGGRVVRVEAPDAVSVAAFRELLSASSGDKDVIAEFAIGLNPGAKEPVGVTLLDEKIGGSVHIAIGMNESFGGKNRANLHLDLVMLRPTVRLDGSLIVADGTLSL
jgi:aminopeptidase